MKLLDDDDREISEINMTPFVDIILVVLIIFLATATFIVEGKIPLNLPKSETAETGEIKEKKLIITIKGDGSLFLDDRKISIKTLKDNIKSAGKNSIIVLRADRSVPFQKVVDVIDACRSEGVEKYTIETMRFE
ncbi:biopolymer transporter ExbD [Persephonella atlantica]|uniref:Biopolymer transporter ExbD n=1 Tax=Persephonella atlantica TaxID=2699429 RepID=A0ABS1GGQ9_9AQUI|nr:biopolymer transporter ExbD [Persephonella atlantica]MBK3332066.1 biopolymer transporter ExbD [Persephonella atlantica]